MNVYTIVSHLYVYFKCSFILAYIYIHFTLCLKSTAILFPNASLLLAHAHTHKLKYMRDFLCLYATLHPFHLFTQCLHFIFRSYPSGSIFFCSLSFFHSFAYITMNVIQRLSVCVCDSNCEQHIVLKYFSLEIRFFSLSKI